MRSRVRDITEMCSVYKYVPHRLRPELASLGRFPSILVCFALYKLAAVYFIIATHPVFQNESWGRDQENCSDVKEI